MTPKLEYALLEKDGMTILAPVSATMTVAFLDCPKEWKLEDVLEKTFTEDWLTRSQGEPVHPIGENRRCLATQVFVPHENPGPRVRLSVVAKERGDGGFSSGIHEFARAVQEGRVVIHR